MSSRIATAVSFAREPNKPGRRGGPLPWTAGSPEQRFHLGEFRLELLVIGHRKTPTGSILHARPIPLTGLGVGSHRRDLRHPAARASASEQNQRSPFDGLIRVRS